MKYFYVCLAAAFLAAGCSTAGSSEAAESSTDKASAESESARKADPAELEVFEPDAAEPKVTSLAWGDDGALQLGYEDAKWARVDTEAQQGELETVLPDEAAVLAVSPAAKLALVLVEHPVVVRLRDRQAVMRLRNIEEVESIGFFAGGKGIYAAEPSGELHVWSSGEAELEKVSSKDLKQFMARQSPDFTANLSPLRGTALLTEDNELFMGTDAGKVLRWKATAPEQVDVVVQLPAAAHTFGYSRGHLAATTAAGELRVVDLVDETFLPWSMKERADWAAATPRLHDAFAVADASTVGVRQFDDGAYRWKLDLPAGEICGLSLSPDATHLAVCLDSGVILLDPKTGEERAALRRTGDTIEWRD